MLTDKVFSFLGKFNIPVSAKTFGFFRILFATHLLLIFSQVYNFRELIFDAIPEISKNVFPVLLFLFIWFISILGLVMGFFTRWSALANYICVVLITSVFTNSNVGTFNDDLLRMGSFLCIFMPVSRCFSVDNIRIQLTNQSTTNHKTSYLNYILFIFLTLGLLYLPSGITKTYSPMWVKGLGLWIPMNIPHNKWNALPNLLVNQYVLVHAINYLVILWEITFVVLLLIPSLHRYAILPGLIFHLGIALFFPFPIVCTGPLVFYALFIPDSFWDWLSEKLSTKRIMILDYQPHDNLQIRIMRLIAIFDFRKAYSFEPSPNTRLTYQNALNSLKIYGFYRPIIWCFETGFAKKFMGNIYHTFMLPLQTGTTSKMFTYNFRQTLFIYFVLFCLVMQGGVSCYHLYSHFTTGPEKRMEYMRKRKSGYDLSMKPTNILRTFLGINSRGLFLDHANTGQKTTYAIALVDSTGMEQWLPMMNQRGYISGDMNRNMAWAKVTFNLMGFGINRADSVGLKKFTKFWASKKHISTQNLHLKVYGKTYTYPTEYEENYYQKLENIPWRQEGEIWWTNGIFRYSQVHIDSIR